MAGGKLSGKTTETVEFLDYVLHQCDRFAGAVEEFASARKPAQADGARQSIARELGRLRQRAMVKNLGVLADEIGRLGILASGSGNQQMKARILRDGVISMKAACERMRRATIAADKADQAAKADTTEGE